jgi:GTP cyclohydrolase II
MSSICHQHHNNLTDAYTSEADSTRLVVIFGIEEAVKEAQNGGSGVVIYFRKEGRALGEVTKVRAMFPQLHATR